MIILFRYEKAANQGSDDAQFNLGLFYEETERDLNKAIYW
jgi:TPR repeat protein